MEVLDKGKARRIMLLVSPDYSGGKRDGEEFSKKCRKLLKKYFRPLAHEFEFKVVSLVESEKPEEVVAAVKAEVKKQPEVLMFVFIGHGTGGLAAGNHGVMKFPMEGCLKMVELLDGLREYEADGTFIALLNMCRPGVVQPEWPVPLDKQLATSKNTSKRQPPHGQAPPTHAAELSSPEVAPMGQYKRIMLCSTGAHTKQDLGYASEVSDVFCKRLPNKEYRNLPQFLADNLPDVECHMSGHNVSGGRGTLTGRFPYAASFRDTNDLYLEEETSRTAENVLQTASAGAATTALAAGATKLEAIAAGKAAAEAAAPKAAAAAAAAKIAATTEAAEAAAAAKAAEVAAQAEAETAKVKVTDAVVAASAVAGAAAASEGAQKGTEAAAATAIVHEQNEQQQEEQQPEEQRRPHVLLAATGSVATIKLVQLAELLLQFAEVKVAATQSATYFFQEHQLPPACQPVLGDKEEWRQWQVVGDPVLHIELRRWADVMVIAPLSANTLAKVANGLCDNLVTCVVRAWDFSKPLLLAPAMNTFMWDSPFTEQHLKACKQLGATVVPPVSKRLACGDVDTSAMAAPEDIAAECRQQLVALGFSGVA